eukprot:g123.t1
MAEEQKDHEEGVEEMEEAGEQAGAVNKDDDDDEVEGEDDVPARAIADERVDELYETLPSALKFLKHTCSPTGDYLKGQDTKAWMVAVTLEEAQNRKHGSLSDKKEALVELLRDMEDSDFDDYKNAIPEVIKGTVLTKVRQRISGCDADEDDDDSGGKGTAGGTKRAVRTIKKYRRLDNQVATTTSPAEFRAQFTHKGVRPGQIAQASKHPLVTKVFVKQSPDIINTVTGKQTGEGVANEVEQAQIHSERVLYDVPAAIAARLLWDHPDATGTFGNKVSRQSTCYVSKIVENRCPDRRRLIQQTDMPDKVRKELNDKCDEMECWKLQVHTHLIQLSHSLHDLEERQDDVDAAGGDGAEGSSSSSSSSNTAATTDAEDVRVAGGTEKPDEGLPATQRIGDMPPREWDSKHSVTNNEMMEQLDVMLEQAETLGAEVAKGHLPMGMRCKELIPGTMDPDTTTRLLRHSSDTAWFVYDPITFQVSTAAMVAWWHVRQVFDQISKMMITRTDLDAGVGAFYQNFTSLTRPKAAARGAEGKPAFDTASAVAMSAAKAIAGEPRMASEVAAAVRKRRAARDEVEQATDAAVQEAKRSRVATDRDSSEEEEEEEEEEEDEANSSDGAEAAAEESMPTPASQRRCKFFFDKGKKCYRGEKCRFSHQ